MDSILNESAFLSRCKALGIVPFEADYVLRVDQDIILSSDDLGDFLSFCTENNLSSIFYNYTYDSVEDHVIDTEDLKKHLLAQFENDWRVTSLQYSHIDSSHFRAVLPDLFLELERAATKQNQAAKTISETRPTLFEAYVPFCGSKVGVMILDNSDGSGALLPDQQQFIKAFENKLSSLLSQKQNEAKQLEIEAVRQREVDYKNALQEIEDFLSTDDRLVGMSQKGVRQEYADTLRIRWSEKIGQNITQKDVRIIVERVYLRRMTNQNA